MLFISTFIPELRLPHRNAAFYMKKKRLPCTFPSIFLLLDHLSKICMILFWPSVQRFQEYVYIWKVTLVAELKIKMAEIAIVFMFWFSTLLLEVIFKMKTHFSHLWQLKYWGERARGSDFSCKKQHSYEITLILNKPLLNHKPFGRFLSDWVHVLIKETCQTETQRVKKRGFRIQNGWEGIMLRFVNKKHFNIKL